MITSVLPTIRSEPVNERFDLSAQETEHISSETWAARSAPTHLHLVQAFRIETLSCCRESRTSASHNSTNW
jgi:hypothetical protein